MKTLKKVLALLLVAIMIFSLAACKKTVKYSTTTYTMIDTFELTTLDYVYNNKSSNGDYTSNFIEGLLTQDNHGTLVAGMAKAWGCNDDASEWWFEIRDNANWVTAEGEVYAAVTAEDFVTGMKHAVEKNSETLGLVSGLIVGLADYIDGKVTWDEVGIVVEGNKLTYKLTQPCGYFDGMTTYSILWPICAKFLEAKGDDFGLVDKASILYNGCYILTSYVPSQEVKFSKNANYWDKDNVHVENVVVSYTDGSDPTLAFNMFVNGEVSASSINSSYEEVVKKANELFADNQYKSMTTATSYWGAFNFDRQSYTLSSDASISTTSKTTDKEKADTKAAILNANFRLAVYASVSAAAREAITKGEERKNDAVRNTLVPYTFATTTKGESYGKLLEKYVAQLNPVFTGINLNDGQDAWYNPERAKALIAEAVKELPDVTWPVTLDVPVLSTSTNNVNQNQALKKSVEDAIGEYVKINLVMFDDQTAYYNSFYYCSIGKDNSIDLTFGAGWGPDYGDPLTYIHCFDAAEGDMLNYSGLDDAKNTTPSGQAAKDAIGLTAIKEKIDAAAVLAGDARIEAFAEIEAMLLTQGILRPATTSGATLVVSTVKPFTAAYGLYGQAAYNVIPYFKYMELQETPVKAADYYTAKENWLAGK